MFAVEYPHQEPFGAGRPDAFGAGAAAGGDAPATIAKSSRHPGAAGAVHGATEPCSGRSVRESLRAGPTEPRGRAEEVRAGRLDKLQRAADRERSGYGR